MPARGERGPNVELTVCRGALSSVIEHIEEGTPADLEVAVTILRSEKARLKNLRRHLADPHTEEESRATD